MRLIMADVGVVYCKKNPNQTNKQGNEKGFSYSYLTHFGGSSRFIALASEYFSG